MSNRGFFYNRKIITATIYPSEQQFKFPFLATHILIAFRNLKNQEIIEFSFNRVEQDGELFPGDGPLSMDGLSKNRIWFKTNQFGQNAAAEIRIWAWHRGGS